jgi:hypothetical protein
MDIFVLDRQLICAVEFPRDGTKVAHWSVYDLDNKKVSWGYSQGMEKSGAGCVPMAMSNAKAAARRILRKRGV